MLSVKYLYGFPVQNPAIAYISNLRTDTPEILWLQSMGIMDPFLSFHNDYTWGKKQPFGLAHITLTDPKGKAIWQAGERYSSNNPYFSHFADGMLVEDRVLGEEARVLVCGTKDGKGVLRIFNLNNGTLRNEIQLPRNDYTWILTGRGMKKHGARVMVLTTQDLGYYAGGLGTHSALFLDARGGIIKEIEVEGDGHFPACFDADGDGYDEFLLGYDLFDHDGTHLWRADLWKNKQIKPLSQHSDQVSIYMDEEGGSWSAIIAGSDALYRIDSHGHTIWKKKWFKWGRRRRYIPWLLPIHVQYLCIGKFMPDDPKDYIFVLHCRESMSLIDMDGRLVWRGTLPENWPLSKPDCVDTNQFHIGTPMTLLKNPLGSGQDYIVYNEGGWPYIINGMGGKVGEFPYPSEAKQSNTFIHSEISDSPIFPPHRPNDWGYGYNCLVHDLDGDSRDEVIIYDRRHCWIFAIDNSKKG